MPFVRSQALTLFIPAHHCIVGTISLEADELGFISRAAAIAEDVPIH
jgi:hypothetical protein